MGKNTIGRIVALLKKEYPKAAIALRYAHPVELLVATILSAQCTDVTVNRVTGSLFRKYKTVDDYADADLKTFEQEIRSAGFYHTKAKNIIAAAGMIRNKFGGRVPGSMGELIQLPGVARKTANIVLFNAFGKSEGIAVDTHVRRLSRRLGLSRHEDPEKIERDLMKMLDKKEWGRFSYLLIEHGRNVCGAKKPQCPACVLRKICPSKRLFFP
ncbi:MAG: endonuclease III [Candidatus Omnitrophica bacterium]|nr:endonuclease III [Candidatus Omnitrophota bacterium]